MVGLYRQSDRTFALPKHGKKPAWWWSRFKSPPPHGHILIGSKMHTPMCSQCAQWTQLVSFKMWCNFLGLY